MMKINIEIGSEDREMIAGKRSKVLVDTYYVIS